MYSVHDRGNALSRELALVLDLSQHLFRPSVAPAGVRPIARVCQVKVGGDQEAISSRFPGERHFAVKPGADHDRISGDVGEMQLVMHRRMPAVLLDPGDDLFHRSTFAQDLDGVAGVAAVEGFSSGVSVHGRQGKSIGIVGQALFVKALLDVVRFPKVDRAVARVAAWIDPVVTVNIHPVVVPAKKDSVALRDGKDGAATGGQIAARAQRGSLLPALWLRRLGFKGSRQTREPLVHQHHGYQASEHRKQGGNCIVAATGSYLLTHCHTSCY